VQWQLGIAAAGDWLRTAATQPPNYEHAWLHVMRCPEANALDTQSCVVIACGERKLECFGDAFIACLRYGVGHYMGMQVRNASATLTLVKGARMIRCRTALTRLRLKWVVCSLQTALISGIAFSSMLMPQKADAVISLEWQCSDSWDTWDGVKLTHGGCGWTWVDHGDRDPTPRSGNDDSGSGPPPRTYSNNNGSQSNDVNKNKSGCPDSTGRPILISSGRKVETYPIFALPGEMGLSFTLYYNTALKIPHALSNTFWSTNLGYTLTDSKCFVNKNTGELICSAKIYQRPDGSTLTFDNQGGAYVEAGGGGGLATLTSNASSPFILHDEDGTIKTFDDNGNIKSITNRSGIGWTITTSAPPAGFTYTVTHSSGKSYSITYGSSNTVTVTDPSSNVYALQRTSDGNYTSITYPGSPSTTITFKYGLSALPYLLTEVDYNGTPYDYTSYNTTSTSPYYGWATANYLADNSESVAISYAKNAAGNLQATITNALGHQRVQTYDGTNGPGGAYNGQLSQVSDAAVADCGATIQSRSYDVNGNLSKEVDNNGNVHTYAYAVTGQLQSETEAYGRPEARTTSYTWDPNLQLNRLASVTIEGWSKSVYTYNAQNRPASVAVTNLSGNGSTGQTLTTTYGYTLYANGMVHTMTVTHPSPGNSDTDTYTYDTLGNLVSLANGMGQVTTYSNYNGLGQVGHVVGPNGDTTDYTYDPRGRIATKTTYPNGGTATWTYGYDGFGELANLAAPDGETTTWNRNAVMRVTSIVRNDKDGASTEGFDYNANGDVTGHTVSRGGVTSLSETIRYDELGRVYQRQGNHGQLLTYGYDGNGNVLSVVDAAGHTVSNEYDALNRLKRTTSSGGASPPMPSTAPALSAPAANSNGSYSVNWNSISGADRYILQKQTNGSGWGVVQNSGSTSFTLSGQGPGTYSYRVQACNGTGCGPWSSTATVTVTHIAGNIDGVPVDGSGNASIGGWACSAGLAQSINVDLYLGGPYGTGTFIGTYVANQSSEPAVASACSVGSGGYRFNIPLSATTRGQYGGKAIYIHGISPVGLDNSLLGNSGNLTVPVNEPAGAPSLSVPSTSSNGSYNVSWSAITDATSYTLQEQVNGGAWATAQSSSALSWTTSGKGNGSYGYRVQACNSSGCGAWSTTVSVTVLLPPPPPASLSVPASSSGSVAVSWPASNTATSYNLQHRLGAGGWSAAYSGSGTSTTVTEGSTGSYTYQVQACNTGGCSGWTGSGAVAVTIPPASTPSLSAPSSSSADSYTVSWSGVSGATSYTLQEQFNGGGWSTVQANGNTSWGASGKGNGSYGYRVQACNAGGCGPWSGTSNVSVTLIPVTPAGLSATLYSEFFPDTRPPKTVYSLTASWSGAAGASSYNFKYCQQSGSCYTTTTTATSVPEFYVQGATTSVAVQACNASGCSAMSAAVTPTTVNR
jgi:YD repeat-containing protein